MHTAFGLENLRSRRSKRLQFVTVGRQAEIIGVGTGIRTDVTGSAKAMLAALCCR